MQIPEGTIGGRNGVWTGVYQGKALLEIGLLWLLSADMEPYWDVTGHGHVIEVKGTPSLRMQYEIERSSDMDVVDSTAETAHPTVNAIPPVVTARSGLLTPHYLPLITAGALPASITERHPSAQTSF